MDFGAFPPLDMVIRTKGDVARRTSGFMAWWIGYAELFFSAMLYPDFDEHALQDAFSRYDSIADQRNFGT